MQCSFSKILSFGAAMRVAQIAALSVSEVFGVWIFCYRKKFPPL